MKRILTSLALIFAFIVQGQTQILNNYCESQSACNARPICGATIVTTNSFTTTAPYNVNPIGTCASLSGTFAYTPNWVYYRVNCYATGIFNFRLVSNDSATVNSDLDWAMWNITTTGCGTLGTPNTIECNAAGNGPTGIAAIPTNNFEPSIIINAGSSYIIGISNPTGANTGGFTMSFGGTTANIQDNKKPFMANLMPFDPCSPVASLKVILSEPVRCSQVGVGVDFTISPTPPSFVVTPGATCPGCANPTATPPNYGNATDTATLTFATAIPPGTYTITAAANAFFDLCGNSDSIQKTIVFTVPVPFKDSVRSGFDCVNLKYIDTVYGVSGISPYEYKAVGGGLPLSAATYTAPTASYMIYVVSGGTPVIYTVRDAVGCEQDTTLNRPSVLALGAPNLSLSASPPCHDQFALDSISVFAQSGGIGPYTFTLAPGLPTVTWNFTPPAKWKNIVFPGLGTIFTVTVTDANGCTKTGLKNLVNPSVVALALPAPTNPKCFGDSSGKICFTQATGGTPGSPLYTYYITPSYPNTTFTTIPGNCFNNLPAGTYTVTATDFNGCTATATKVLSQPAVITINTSAATILNPTCPSNCNGTYQPIATGGTGGKKFYKYPFVGPGPLTYSDSVVSSIAPNNKFLGLCPGTYTILAVDALGCTATATVTLAWPASPNLNLVTVNPVPCFGGNGSIAVNVSPGVGNQFPPTAYTTANYSIFPTPGGLAVSTAAPGGSNATFNNIPADTYTIVVTNNNQCADTINVIMTQPSAPVTYSSVVVDSVLCFGTSTGVITAQATGGTPGVNTYQYSIKIGAAPFTAFSAPTLAPHVYSGLAAGTYTIRVRDHNLCTRDSIVTIYQPTKLNLLLDDVDATCFGTLNGEICVVDTGGTANYQYKLGIAGAYSAPQTPGFVYCFNNLAAGNYSVFTIDAKGCLDTLAVNIASIPLPVVSFTASPNDTVCDGTAITLCGTGADTYSWTGGINDCSAFVPALGSSQYIVTGTNTTTTCTNTDTVDVLVNPIPVATPVADQIVCNGLLTTAVNFNSSVSGSTFTWSHNTPGCGIASPGAGNIPSFTAVNTGTLPLVVTFTVTPTGPNTTNCVGPDITFTITINPSASIALTSAAGTDAQTVCIGELLLDIDYTISGGGTGATVAGLPAGVTGLYNFPIMTLSGTPTGPAGTYTYTVTTTGTCAQTSTTGTIIVSPDATVALSSPIGTDSQTPCINTAITAITYTIGGTGNNGIVTGLPLGVTGTYAAGVVTISGSPSVSGLYTYTVTATGTCASAFITGTINVIPLQDPSFTYPSSTYCQTGVDPLPIITGAVGGTFSCANPLLILNSTTGLIDLSASALATYTIKYVTSGQCPDSTTFTLTITLAPTAGFSYIPISYCQSGIDPLPTFAGGASAGLFSAVPAGLVIDVTTGEIDLSNSPAGTYTVKNFIVAAGGCDSAVATTTVIIDSTTILTDPADQIVCNNTLTAAVNFVSTLPSTYAWSHNTPGCGIANSGTGNIPAFTALNAGTTPIVVTFTVTPTGPASNFCVGLDQTFTITINPTPVLTDPADQILCAGDFTTDVNFVSTVAGTVFNWTNSNNTIGLPFFAGTGDILTFQGLNTSNVPNIGIITITPTANGCPGANQTFTYTINPIPVVTDPADQIVCNNTSTAAVNFASSVVGTTYTWTNDQPSIGLLGSGSGNIPSFTAINTGITPIVATIVVTGTGPNPTNCPALTQSFTITVNPTPNVDPNLDQTVCAGAFTNTVIFTGNVTGTVYSWTNSNPSIGLAAVGTGDIPSFVGTNITSVPQTGIIIVTTNAAGCPGTTDTFTITVDPIPAVNTIANQTICDNENSTLINISSNVIGTTFIWSYSATSNIGLTPTSGTGNTIPVFTAVNTGTTPIVATFTVTPTGPANGNCDGNDLTFTITVLPRQNPSFTYAPSTFCQTGTDPLPIFGAGATLGGTFSATPAGLSINASTGLIDLSASLLNTYTVKYVTPGPCPDSATFNVTISLAPEANFTYANANYCQQALINPLPIFIAPASAGTFSATPAGLNFVNINTGEIDLATSNAGVYTVSNIIAAAGGCAADTGIFTITIDSATVLTDPTDIVVCNNTATGAIVFASTLAGTTYTWTNNNTSIGLAATSGGSVLSIPSFTAVNTTNAPIIATVTVTPLGANGCPGLQHSFTITVNPTPVVTDPADQVWCPGYGTNAVNFVSNVAGTTFSWTNSNTAIGIGAGPTAGNLPSFITTNTGSTSLVGIFTVTPTGPAPSSCPGLPVTFSITVNPDATLVLTSPAGTASQIVCEGTAITPIVYSIGGSGNNATVTGMPAGITGSYAGGVFTITGSSTAFGNYIYSVIATGTCGNDTLSGSLEITPLQDPTFTYPTFTNCQFGTTVWNFVATLGGVFSATAVSPPGVLVIDPLTGVINLAASDTGLYTIKYVTPGPCPDSATLNIFVTTAPSAQFTYASANYCQSAPNPSPNYGPNASAGTFSAIPAGLQFTPGLPAGRIDLLNSLPGIYQVINTIAPSGACPGVADTFTVTITSKPSLAFVSSTPAGCNPNCNGTFTTSTTGGSPGYLYSILPATASINALGVASALCVGTTYTITVTDAIGCTGTMTATVTQSISPILNITSQTNTTTLALCDGTATTAITPLTGTPGFIYTIAGPGTPLINGAGFATQLCGDTACVTYTIVVTDSKGCKDTVNPCIFAPGLLNCSQTHTDVLCFGDTNGTFIDSVFGGTPPYLFSLAGPITTFTQVSPTKISGSGLPAGNYIVTVTDSNGVICTNPFTIATPAQLIFTAPVINTPSCSPGCDGTLSITANGGTGTKTYAIQSPIGMTCTALPGSTAGSFTGLGVGTYTIIVTDGNLCTASTTVQINASPLPTVALSHTNPLCNNNCNGTITAVAGPGTSPYTYSIVSPAGSLCTPTQSAPTSGNFTTLGSGIYTIVVIDFKGCTVSDTELLVNPPVLALNPPSSTPPLCFGDNNATITLVGVGGTGTLTYSITPSSGTQTSPGVFTGLSSGTYTVGVTDATNCSITGTVQINDPTVLSWTTATATNITCAGSNNGIINTAATGGTGTKEYSKDGAIFVPSGSFTGLAAGTYTITAKDANGCTLTTTFTIVEPPLLTLGAPVVVDVTCNGANNGSITIVANGGTPGYQYSIAPNSGTQTSPGVFINLPNGTYAITVTDTVGCSKVATGIVVNQPAPLVFTLVNHQDVACFGDATGTITANTQGGTPVVSYSLNPNLGVQSPAGFFSGLLAGTYVVTATDTKGCTTSTVVTIAQGPQIIVSNVTTIEPICNGDANGTISFTVSGGTGQLKYQLNGGPLQNDTVFNNLLAGNYLLTVVDALGCKTDQVIILLEPDPVSAIVNLIGANCIDSKDGKAIIVGQGGRGGYKYYLTPGLHINKSGIFVGLEKGTYVLRVVDTAGCEYKTQITIDPPANPLSTTITKQDLACNGVGNEGSATAIVAGGTPPYTYFWSTDPPQVTPKASTLYFGYYDVTVTDANGCTIKDTTYIEEGPCCDVAFIPNAFSPNGDQNNDEFRVLTTAGIELLQLEIYNRWGKRVFATIDYRRGWDGTIDGKQGAVDTYFYIFRYKCTRDNLTYTKKGDILLIR